MTHDNSGRDVANLDLKHLGPAPVRTSRHRILSQSPSIYVQFQAAVTPNGRTPRRAESDSPPDTSCTPSLHTEVDSSLSPKFANSSPRERTFLGQAPARAQTAQFAEMCTVQLSSNGKSLSSAAFSAQNIDVRDAEHKTSMHILLQQLDEMAVAKQRITEEFRASQQLTAQALRRLDEECERRQQMQLRVMETEAALKILGQICEEKTAELASVHAKLEVSECRVLKMEQRMAAHSVFNVSLTENKVQNDTDVPDVSTHLVAADLNVIFFI